MLNCTKLVQRNILLITNYINYFKNFITFKVLSLLILTVFYTNFLLFKATLLLEARAFLALLCVHVSEEAVSRQLVRTTIAFVFITSMLSNLDLLSSYLILGKNKNLPGAKSGKYRRVVNMLMPCFVTNTKNYYYYYWNSLFFFHFLKCLL